MMTTYTDAVAEARGLIKRSEQDQWRLAELTWEQVEAGKTRMQWAQDIGVDKSYANRLYRVWARWGEEDLSSRPKFSQAYNDVDSGSYDDKINRGIRNLPPERKAEVARELLAEPEVAEQVVNDDMARSNVHQALDRRYDQAPKPYKARPETPAHDHAIEVLVSLRGISAAIKRATDVILSGPQLDSADDLLAVVDWQANALNIIRTALTGRSDVDAELAKILENGS